MIISFAFTDFGNKKAKSLSTIWKGLLSKAEIVDVFFPKNWANVSVKISKATTELLISRDFNNIGFNSPKFASTFFPIRNDDDLPG